MDLDKLKDKLQTEVGAAFLYVNTAAIQSDGILLRVLLSLSDVENTHAKHMFDKALTLEPNYKMPLPSGRAKFELKLRKIFGCTFIISNLSNIEKQFAVMQ